MVWTRVQDLNEISGYSVLFIQKSKEDALKLVRKRFNENIVKYMSMSMDVDKGAMWFGKTDSLFLTEEYDTLSKATAKDRGCTFSDENGVYTETPIQFSIYEAPRNKVVCVDGSLRSIVEVKKREFISYHASVDEFLKLFNKRFIAIY